MGTKKAAFAGSAWSALRMALLWARKGGAFRLAERKRLKTSAKTRSDRVHCYLERQFSMDETPAFNFKMHRPASLRWFSCVNSAPAAADFDNERNFFKWDEQSEVCDDDDDDNVDTETEMCGVGNRAEELVQEEGIDSKAEEFIARFYDEMKMQRQISFLQYNEMLERSMS